MEVVLPKERVLYYSILECFNPLGAVVMALIASRVKDWRLLLRISNVPGLLFLSYIWFFHFNDIIIILITIWIVYD